MFLSRFFAFASFGFVPVLSPVLAVAHERKIPTQEEMGAAIQSVAAAQAQIQVLLDKVQGCVESRECGNHPIPDARDSQDIHPENDRAAQFALLGMSVVLNNLAEKVDEANLVYGQPEFLPALATACVTAHDAKWKNSAARVSADLPEPGIILSSDFDDPGIEIAAVISALHCN